MCSLVSTRVLTLPRHFVRCCSSAIVRSPYPLINIPECTVDEFLWRNVDRWATKTAVVCGATGRSYTYNQVQIFTGNLAAALRMRLNLKVGDVVAIMTPNVPEFFIAFLALVQAGLTVTTINPIYTSDEISRQIIDSEAKAIFTLSGMWNLVNSARQSLKNNMPIITINTQIGESTPLGAINFRELCDYKPSSRIFCEFPNDLVILPYSSGTTGLPKGVRLTQKNIVSNLTQIQYEEIRINYETTDNHQDVIPVVLPLFHLYALMLIFLNMFSMGCKLITLPRYHPDLFLDMMKRYHPHILHAVPPIVLLLNNYKAVRRDHLLRVRTVLSAAAPLSAEDTNRFLEKFDNKIRLIQGYGLSETSPLSHVQRIAHEPQIGGSGCPIPNTECRVVSLEEPARDLGPNESGQVLIRGPQVMQGYHKNLQATKDTIDVDGWLKTGDIGHYNEEKEFFITDRLKELIKVKGYQVAPAELEAVLRDHPGIEDAGVTGIFHPQHGEVPKAFVVPKPDSRLTPDIVQDYINSRVAKYKRLTGGIVFVQAIPKNPSGKILRRLLKNM